LAIDGDWTSGLFNHGTVQGLGTLKALAAFRRASLGVYPAGERLVAS
jgi:hypothetical protein